MTSEPIDLGHGHTATVLGWHHGMDDVPDTDVYGLDYEHPSGRDGRPCAGHIVFDNATSRALGWSRVWTLENVDPLTVSPSLLCGCGDHGFIREGRWVPA